MLLKTLLPALLAVVLGYEHASDIKDDLKAEVKYCIQSQYDDDTSFIQKNFVSLLQDSEDEDEEYSDEEIEEFEEVVEYCLKTIYEVYGDGAKDYIEECIDYDDEADSESSFLLQEDEGGDTAEDVADEAEDDAEEDEEEIDSYVDYYVQKVDKCIDKYYEYSQSS
mmetsp:Transcript_15938/g.29185  ORF Transcript_15938/g.29185 Transcript_15938/m.29185 type:complete len:166 (+) Transcript_15938:334-831(+)